MPATLFEVLDDRARVVTRTRVAEMGCDHVGSPAALRDLPSGEATDALGEAPSAAQQQQLGCADAASQPLGDLGDGAILEVVGAQRARFPFRETSEGEGEVHFALRRPVVPDDRRFDHDPHPVPSCASVPRSATRPAATHAYGTSYAAISSQRAWAARKASCRDVFGGGPDERPNGAHHPTELQSVELDEVDLEDAADRHEQVSPPLAARRNRISRLAVSRRVGCAPRRATRSTA